MHIDDRQSQACFPYISTVQVMCEWLLQCETILLMEGIERNMAIPCIGSDNGSISENINTLYGNTFTMVNIRTTTLQTQ